MCGEVLLGSLVEHDDGRDSSSFGDVDQDGHPDMSELGVVGDVAVPVRCFGDVGNNADKDGNENELEDGDPFPAIPGEHVNRLLGLLGVISLLLTGHAHGERVTGIGKVDTGEKEGSLVFMRRDKF